MLAPYAHCSGATAPGSIVRGMRADVAVVGAGVIGLSAALAMHDRGARVLLLDPGSPGGGQSVGPGRVFRHLHERPELVGLARAARRGWRRAEERFGLTLLGRDGALLVGPIGDHGDRLAAAELPHRVLDAAGIAAAMPALGAGPAEGLLDEEAGAIDAEAYVAALANALRDRILAARALSLREGPGGAAIVTDRGLVLADRVLVAAGSGGGALARALGLEIPLAEGVHHRVAFRAAGAPRPLPCLLERSGRFGERAYGLPLPGGDYAVGCASLDGRPTGEAVALTAAYVRRALPGLGPSTGAVVRCLTTTLADHPERLACYRAGAVSLLVGGNLFKLAPALAQVLADAVLEDRLDAVVAPPTRSTRVTQGLTA
jgi:glycine/D-amino acid oxidase-like deaminating enzyme